MNKKNYTSWVLGIIVLIVNITNSYAQPTKTIGKPEDIANVAAFLINKETQFITGQTIYVDGGKSIGAGI